MALLYKFFAFVKPLKINQNVIRLPCNQILISVAHMNELNDTKFVKIRYMFSLEIIQKNHNWRYTKETVCCHC